MKIVVITNDELKEELLAQGLQEDAQVEWQEEIKPIAGAGAYIDLLFTHSAERIDKLNQLPSTPAGQPPIIMVNAVNHVLNELPADFIRINGWNSFLQRSLLEAAAAEENKQRAEKIFAAFNKTAEWVPDMRGFITARVISMIINEAFFALEEKVSTKEEIDTAMKLGTNYPFGPFEWGAVIGLKKDQRIADQPGREQCAVYTFIPLTKRSIMSLILNIDTALDTGSVCLAREKEIIALSINENKKDQPGWLHSTIDDILKKNNLTPHQLEAVAVSIGPGSYTGLRVGLAAAKGFCFALQIPLIAVNTLKMMAAAVKEEASALICPLIDARRMEVFMAIYDASLREIVSPNSLEIDENSFRSLLSSSEILFCGNGHTKLRPLLTNKNAFFTGTSSNASHLSGLSQICFLEKEFADLAYTEPLYIKEFYTPFRKT